MLEIKAYKCEYCNKKIYQNKSSCIRHEKKCFANPKMKACRSCEYLVKILETVYVQPHGDQNYGDADYDKIELICTKRKDVRPNETGRFENNCNLYKYGGGDSFAKGISDEY